MKIWLEKIMKNSSYIKIVSEYYRKDLHNITTDYQKVESYTITDDQVKDKKPCKVNKIESTLNKAQHTITDLQAQELKLFIEDAMTLYNNDSIYLTELDKKYYETVYEKILNKERNVDKELYDYIIRDIIKSRRRK
jgi:hypothetical protein